MRLVPMNLCSADASIAEANAGNTFEFPPSANSILPTEPHDFTDVPTYGNCFDSLNCAYNFKVHWILYPPKQTSSSLSDLRIRLALGLAPAVPADAAKAAFFPALVNLCCNRPIVGYPLRLGPLLHPAYGSRKERPTNLAQRLF